MAQKKITDLQLRSNFDASVSVPVDDASQTWRSTGAQIRDFVHNSTGSAFTEETEIAADDMLILWDTSAAAARKASKGNFRKRTTAAKTASYTATANDDVLLCNATAAAIVISLPAAASSAGRMYTVKKTDASANFVTLDANGSETIDGRLIAVLESQNDSITVVCDGAAWHIANLRILDRSIVLANNYSVSGNPAGDTWFVPNTAFALTLQPGKWKLRAQGLMEMASSGATVGNQKISKVQFGTSTTPGSGLIANNWIGHHAAYGGGVMTYVSVNYESIVVEVATTTTFYLHILHANFSGSPTVNSFGFRGDTGGSGGGMDPRLTCTRVA